MTPEQFKARVSDHVVEMSNPEPGKYQALNFANLQQILNAIDAKTQEVMPLLNSLLPAQWDAIAKIVAAGIHGVNTAINPPGPAA